MGYNGLGGLDEDFLAKLAKSAKDTYDKNFGPYAAEPEPEPGTATPVPEGREGLLVRLFTWEDLLRGYLDGEDPGEDLGGEELYDDEDLGGEDLINHPSHYTSYKGVEVIQLTEQMNFNRGNAVKYIARAGLKDPATEIQDLEKAAWYINREIGRLNGDN